MGLLSFISIFFIDFYERGIEVFVKGEKEISTVFGKFVTLLTIAVMMSIASYFFSDLINKTNPNLQIQELLTDDYPTAQMNISEIMVGFRLFGIDINQINRYFYLSAFYQSPDEPSGIILNLDICKNSYDPSNLPKGFNDSNIWCPADLNVTVQGSVEQDSTVYIEIYSCINSTENNNSCATPEEINEMAFQQSYDILYTQNLVNPNDYESPIIRTSTKFSDYLDPALFKMVLLNYKELEFESDDGFMFSNASINSQSLLDQAKVQMTTRNKYLPMLRIVVTTVSKQLSVSRTYSKIQDVLSNIGGIQEWILITGEFIVKLFFTFVKKRDYANIFFDFTEYNNKSKDTKKEVNHKMIEMNDISSPQKFKFARIANKNNLSVSRNSSIRKLSDMPPLSIRNDDVADHQNFGENDKKDELEKSIRDAEILEEKKMGDLTPLYKNIKKKYKNSNQLHANVFEVLLMGIFKNLICCKGIKNKFKIYAVLFEDVKRRLDLTNILSYMRQFDFVKSVIMNPEQNAYLNHFNKMKFNENILNKDDKKQKREAELISMYKYFKTNHNTEDIADKKLFIELEECHKILFENFEKKSLI